ncbi:MAG TPA: TolC family protein [Gemmataceae bacterium]|nr:TolC family protein [Gemmataceae bacterium]
MRLLLVLLLAGLLGGCTRAFYRRQADREAYSAIEERNDDPRWALPRIAVDPPPESRLHDAFNPDRPPMPPDDPAAHEYMHRVNGIRGYRKWHKDGDAPWIEDPQWLESLPLGPNGTLPLTPERAVELGLLHSREYQNVLDQLYLSSLALTLDRFEFALHWFLTNATTFTHFGSGPTDSNTLTTNTNFGFTRAFATGGQLLVDFANSFVFQYSGKDQTTATSNILIGFVQPLLRNGGKAFRLEELTEAERTLLYRVRDFARFRKQFSFEIATVSYLKLLLQEQSIRNQRTTLAKLEENLRLHQALMLARVADVSSVKVDQVDLSVQQARGSLIQAESALETARDQYKNTLGLPPRIPIHLDDGVLNPFQLTDPALDALEGEVVRFLAEYRELDQAPPLAKLQDGFKNLKAFHARLTKLVEEVRDELSGWQKQLEAPGEDAESRRRAREEQKDRRRELDELRQDIKSVLAAIDKAALALVENKREDGWKALQNRSLDVIDAVSQLLVLQTQVRVYLLKLRLLHYPLGPAIEYAFANRLDLMNQRAKVVDAWRQITVTANGLAAGLDVTYNGNIATPPAGNRPFDFRASASSHSVGLRIDGPLNRVAERNDYRASQITYQRARRDYMALEDQIERAIRLDLRQLETERFNFEIARRSLIIAARQGEAARMELLGINPDPTSTQNILLALNGVLSAKNSLIGSWVNYEIGRMQLLLDLEALQLDERGLYREDSTDFATAVNDRELPQPAAPARAGAP